MENMAAMLSEVAGGLQQSFGSVFERVGQSLEQSAQMMQMMNGMMEAALLQNLVVTYTVQASASSIAEAGSTESDVCITVENRSQITLSEVVVSLYLGSDGAASGDGEKTERALEQGLEANSVVQVVVPLPRNLLGSEGNIRLSLRSPGTQQWISKEVLFRIPVLKMANIEAVLSPLSSPEASVHTSSDRVSIAALRDALRVSAFDPLLTSASGHYRVSVSAGILGARGVVFHLSIHQTAEAPTGARVFVAFDSTSDQEETTNLQRVCQVVIEELESL